MEIETCYRKEKIWDEAKDKTIAALYDDSEKPSHHKIYREGVNIVCSDGISIDAEIFKRESIVAASRYEHDLCDIEVESNSKIIKKVEHFCGTRAMIQNYYACDDYHLQQKKLNSFNSNFRQHNRIYALDLMIAAFDLQIRSLVDLMMEDVVDVFAKMTSDEAYKILFVNLTGEYKRGKFEFMKKGLISSGLLKGFK
ncbi:uncharacterized protein [Rutidosis leptorrhynchoides]|uniref:uncharacterized protein n=1 Tax=Rutidosis leptorrhynchoides TaxID=125765 RepID=UPI003A9A36BB